MYKFTCSYCNATYYRESGRYFFVKASEHHGVTPVTGKRVKIRKKSAIFDHILLKGYDANFEDFTILLKKNKKFTLHLKESLSIKHDNPELNRNIYSYLLELSDWLLLNNFLFTYLLICVNYSFNVHDILSIADSSSLLFEIASDERTKQKNYFLI